MYVITADQRGSRRAADRVPEAIAVIERMPPAPARSDDAERSASGIRLPPERTAGDEVQVGLYDPARTLEIALELTRRGDWSVGIGIGTVEDPLPPSVRAARGDAFVNARDAVDRAKKSRSRVAVRAADEDAGADVEALLRLLVELRDRRTAEGWAVHDLLREGITQRAAAQFLEISPAAVSLRVKAAALRVEDAARPALVRALGRLDPGVTD